MDENVRKSDITQCRVDPSPGTREILPQLTTEPPITASKRRWKLSFSMALAALGIWVKAEVEREHNGKL